MHVDAVPAVSCCAAIYDRILTAPADSATPSRMVALAFPGHLTSGIILLVLAALEIRFPGRVPGGLITALAVMGSLAASVTVKQVWSSYYYQVLCHHRFENFHKWFPRKIRLVHYASRFMRAFSDCFKNIHVNLNPRPFRNQIRHLTVRVVNT